LIDAVESDRTPILITQYRLPAAYLVDVETYERQQKLLNLLEGIARGEKAVDDGRVMTYAKAKKHAAMVEIVWTEPALNDLDAIADYIALDKLDAARKLVQRLFAHIEELSLFVMRGERELSMSAVKKRDAAR
jgi:prevent-host-death family protein